METVSDLHRDEALLIEAFRLAFRSQPSGEDSGGWLNPALDVLDCILSLNRHYDRFCFPRVERFAERHPGVSTLDALLHLIGEYPTPLEFSIAELNYNHEDRAETLVGVVKYLIQVQRGYQGSSELLRLKAWAEAAKPSDSYAVGVRGFGLSGFQYLRILLGAQTVKPDVHIRRFASEAVGHSVSDEQAIELFEAAGKHLDWKLTPLDYAVWDRRARGRNTSD